MSERSLWVLLALCVAGFAALLWSRPHAPAPPGIVELRALDKTGKLTRPLTAPPTLRRDEALDFHVQVAEPGYVYVFRKAGEKAWLEWGPGIRPSRLEPGVWAPEWEDERVQGLRFVEGEALIYVLASLHPVPGIESWSSKDLEQPEHRCPLCSVVTLPVKITAPAPADAGQ